MLTGIEVLDAADAKASYCTKILALLGARVIKIEPPAGDRERRRGPFLEAPSERGISLSYCYHNVSKLSITLNLSRPAGRQLFRRLIERADVFVETFSPAQLKKFSCEYDVLRTINQRLIHVSVSGFGRQGPRSQYESDDLVAAAYGGPMSVCGSPHTPPLKPGGNQSHFAGSLFAVLAILLSLHKRRKSGQGEYLDLSVAEAMTSTLEHVLVRYLQQHIIAGRRGGRHWDDAFCIFPCRDGFIQMTVFHQWDTMVGLMAQDGMAGDLAEEKWASETCRRSHSEHVINLIGAWTRRHAVGELFQLGQLMGFPWAPVQSPAAILESEQLKERAFFLPLSQPETVRPIPHPGLPVRFSDYTLPPLKGAPAVGEDNIRIYRDELGLGEDELERLTSEGII